jgi:hypothetical protein
MNSQNRRQIERFKAIVGTLLGCILIGILVMAFGAAMDDDFVGFKGEIGRLFDAPSDTPPPARPNPIVPVDRSQKILGMPAREFVRFILGFIVSLFLILTILLIRAIHRYQNDPERIRARIHRRHPPYRPSAG